MTHTEQRAAPPRSRPPFLRSQLVARFGKFAIASVLSTLVSQVTLMGVYGLGGRTALVASVCAFAAGAVPNFLINRRWAWGRKGRQGMARELLPYLIVVIAGGVASTGLITLADSLLEPVLASRGWRTLALDGVYVASYGLLFIVKFALLDRLVFRQSRSRPAQ